MTTEQLTLGDMIKILEGMDQAALVSFSIDWCSYRGDYYDLGAMFCFPPRSRTYPPQSIASTKVCELLEDTKEVVGCTFGGWKGGEYTMNEASVVWIADDGFASGEPMTVEAFAKALATSPQ